MKKRNRTIVAALLWIVFTATVIHCIIYLDASWMTIIQVILVYALYECIKWLVSLLDEKKEEKTDPN